MTKLVPACCGALVLAGASDDLDGRIRDDRVDGAIRGNMLTIATPANHRRDRLRSQAISDVSAEAASRSLGHLVVSLIAVKCAYGFLAAPRSGIGLNDRMDSSPVATRLR